ncbi:MAG: type II secretion system F family protein [Planctomycetota bacterium]
MLFPNLTAVFGPARATRAQRRSLLRLVASAAENRLPLAGTIDALADEERGRQRKRLIRLAESLRSGVALPDALERQPTLLGEEERLMVRFASESGTLAPTIRRSLERTSDESSVTGGNAYRIAAYGLLLVFVGLPIAIFVQMVLTSEMIYIYYDFGLEPPPLLQVNQLLSEWIAPACIVWLVALLAVLWLRLFDWPFGYVRRVLLPRLSKSFRDRQIATVLRTLGDSAQSGRPIAGAVATLARYHYDPQLRNQLLYLRNELGLGADLWSTLSAEGGLTECEQAALVAADRLGTRGWTLAALADARRRRADTRQACRSAIALPLVVLVFGAFVTVQALGVFSFLARLIGALA